MKPVKIFYFPYPGCDDTNNLPRLLDAGYDVVVVMSPDNDDDVVQIKRELLYGDDRYIRKNVFMGGFWAVKLADRFEAPVICITKNVSDIEPADIGRYQTFVTNFDEAFKYLESLLFHHMLSTDTTKGQTITGL